MASEEHQTLVNLLAQRLEEQRGIKIVRIDMAGTLQYFEQKYHNLPKPKAYNGSIPDLVGKDTKGITHLGEAETDMEAENLNNQLLAFSRWRMTKTKIPVPLHVIVPRRIKHKMESRIRSIGLGDKLDHGRITIWPV